MTDPFDQSVLMCIQYLNQDDDAAAAKIWNRYFNRLVCVASINLGNAARLISDEEDVAGW